MILTAIALPAYAGNGNGNGNGGGKGNGGMHHGAAVGGECRIAGECLNECPGCHSAECPNGLTCTQGVDCPIRETRIVNRASAGKYCKGFRACEFCGYTAP